jgi:hypothetical protein
MADRWSLPQANSDSKIRQDAGFWNAQGIEAVSFFAADKKDTSVKPGPARRAGCAQIPD